MKGVFTVTKTRPYLYLHVHMIMCVSSDAQPSYKWVNTDSIPWLLFVVERGLQTGKIVYNLASTLIYFLDTYIVLHEQVNLRFTGKQYTTNK